MSVFLRLPCSSLLPWVFVQIWPQQLADTDKVYEAFVTGCALAGPEGCPIASPNASASDVDATIQALLQDARDAARKDASAPVTSADIRSKYALYLQLAGADAVVMQKGCFLRCTSQKSGPSSRTRHTPRSLPPSKLSLTLGAAWEAQHRECKCSSVKHAASDVAHSYFHHMQTSAERREWHAILQWNGDSMQR